MSDLATQNKEQATKEAELMDPLAEAMRQEEALSIARAAAASDTNIEPSRRRSRSRSMLRRAAVVAHSICEREMATIVCTRELAHTESLWKSEVREHERRRVDLKMIQAVTEHASSQVNAYRSFHTLSQDWQTALLSALDHPVGQHRAANHN